MHEDISLLHIKTPSVQFLNVHIRMMLKFNSVADQNYKEY